MTPLPLTGRIGVFGGSFDPPHCGHVLLAAYALSAAPIDRVLVVPTFAHPFGKQMQPFEDRVAMCERAFALLPGVAVSRIEETLGAPSYTVRTLEALRAQLADAELRLLIGADVLADVGKWKDFDRVTELARPFVIGRGGHSRDGVPAATLDLPEVSSTKVRALLRDGASAAGMVPLAVDEYCRERGLYRG